MERIRKSLLIIIICIIPLLNASGQKRTGENHVRIVIDDNTGSETIVDTTFSGENMPETITLKDGSIIYLDEDNNETIFPGNQDISKKIFITLTDEGDGSLKKERKVIITGSDSTVLAQSGSLEKQIHVFVQNKGEGSVSDHDKQVIIASADGKGKNNDGNSRSITVITHDGSNSKDEGTFSIVGKKDIYIDGDATKYVIAKNGIVITIEGNDEAKVKEILDLINNKMKDSR